MNVDNSGHGGGGAVIDIYELELGLSALSGCIM
jgi:hypothetical protein